jgi:hypothetical protein
MRSVYFQIIFIDWAMLGLLDPFEGYWALHISLSFGIAGYSFLWKQSISYL